MVTKVRKVAYICREGVDKVFTRWGVPNHCPRGTLQVIGRVGKDAFHFQVHSSSTSYSFWSTKTFLVTCYLATGLACNLIGSVGCTKRKRDSSFVTQSDNVLRTSVGKVSICVPDNVRKPLQAEAKCGALVRGFPNGKCPVKLEYNRTLEVSCNCLLQESECRMKSEWMALGWVSMSHSYVSGLP